ncbi:MAG: hypothetical protein ISS82_03425 [Nanoarchaeota archaeon]|nr:hypothetical protein [Nanoarchaeota archaeon]
MQREEAWKTSINQSKINFTGEDYKNIKSPYNCYMNLMENLPENNSGHQWSKEYQKGLPIIKTFFNNFSSSDKQLIEEIKNTFNQIRTENQDMKIGVIADMCAVAIFLYLSYN